MIFYLIRLLFDFRLLKNFACYHELVRELSKLDRAAYGI